MSSSPPVKRVRNETCKNKIFLVSGARLYLQSEFADVHFMCNSSNDFALTRIPAHKNLLAVASDVFKIMFYGSLREEGDIWINDASAPVFEEFLQFFYLDEVELTMEHIGGVIHLGHKYNVIECLDVCKQFLLDHLTDENACVVLRLAVLYDITELIQMCEKRISVNTEAVFESTSFLTCDRTVLAHILTLDLLSCSESDVFEACISWVKASSKQNVLTRKTVQDFLGDLFYEIRFASMTLEEFAVLYTSNGCLFSPAEYIDLNQMMILQSYQPTIFNRNMRQVKWNEDDVLKCDRKVDTIKRFGLWLKETETISFSTNEPILLGRLICARISAYRSGSHQDLKSNLPVEVKIVESPNVSSSRSCRLLSSFKISLPSKKETEVALPKTVLIRPGFLYQIHLMLTPECHCFEIVNLHTNVVFGPGIDIQFDDDRMYKNQAVGLVTGLQFNRI